MILNKIKKMINNLGVDPDEWFKKDEEPRKKRVDTPKSTPGLADAVVWVTSCFEEISNITNKAFLAINKKSNMRQLTKAQVSEL